MKSLDHPNIIKFYGTFQDQKYFHLVMEYCQGGSLLDRFIKRGKFTEPEAAKIMEKLFSAVEYLHQNGISHRDLKLDNFLFVDKSEDSEIRIIDFGLSTTLLDLKNKGKSLNSKVGTPIYMAPEVIQGDYDERCDNWSLGVILYQLLNGHTAFKGDKRKEVFKQILKGEYIMDTPEYKSLSDYAKHLISKFLIVNPNHRFTAV